MLLPYNKSPFWGNTHTKFICVAAYKDNQSKFGSMSLLQFLFIYFWHHKEGKTPIFLSQYANLTFIHKINLIVIVHWFFKLKQTYFQTKKGMSLTQEHFLQPTSVQIENIIKVICYVSKKIKGII